MKSKSVFKLILLAFICSFPAFSQVSMLLKDINPGGGSSLVYGVQTYCSFNGSLVFAAQNAEFGHEVWIYKNNEVSLLKDINPGNTGSEADYFFELNGKLVFSAETEESGFELWTSDGTTEGTQLLADFNAGTKDGVFAGPGSSLDRFLVFDNKLYFTGIQNSSYALWYTDGTKEGTMPVKNISSKHSFPVNLTAYKDELYFNTAFDGVFKINKETEEIEEVVALRSTYNLLATDDLLYVLGGSELWTTTGTKAGSKKVLDIDSPTVNWRGNRLVELNKMVYFPNYTSDTGNELWQTDGTSLGTKIVKDVWPGSKGYAPQNYTLFKNKLFYKGEQENTGIELFETDGTADGTQMVINIDGTSNSSFHLPTTLISDDKRLYFNASDSFYSDLFISDGTENGTRKIRVTNDRSGADEPENFFLFDNKLVVFADDNETGYEPYIIDFDLEIDDPDADGYVGEDDCDETNPAVNKGAAEIFYNGLDDDCNPLTLDDDIDNDGYIAVDDCDDTDANVHPNAIEIPYNGKDDDCNPETLDDDFDRDGYIAAEDCNDGDASINPDAEEIPYNGIDEDCNPATLDDDFDNDGYLSFEDCNDNEERINPGATEIPNNDVDENCDGIAEQILSLNAEDETIAKVYPNPSNGIMHVENVEVKSLKINDSKGRRVVFKVENNTLKLINPSIGTFFIEGKTKSDKKHFTRKVLILSE